MGVIFTPKNMKRDFLLGGTKLPTGGAVRGAGGAMSPPVFMLKEALLIFHVTDQDGKSIDIGEVLIEMYLE